jgi:hypothetical protein
MTRRKALGFALVGTPFVGLAAVFVFQLGLLATICIFAFALVVTAMIVKGVEMSL